MTTSTPLKSHKYGLRLEYIKSFITNFDYDTSGDFVDTKTVNHGLGYIPIVFAYEYTRFVDDTIAVDLIPRLQESVIVFGEIGLHYYCGVTSEDVTIYVRSYGGSYQNSLDFIVYLFRLAED